MSDDQWIQIVTLALAAGGVLREVLRLGRDVRTLSRRFDTVMHETVENSKALVALEIAVFGRRRRRRPMSSFEEEENGDDE